MDCPEIEAHLPAESRPTVNDVSLDEFIRCLMDDDPIRSRIQAELNSPIVRELALDAVERRELDRALQRLASVVFVPVVGQPTWSPSRNQDSSWLWEWWKPQQYLAGEYTLDGANLPLVCPAAGATRDDLICELRSPSSDVRNRAWYRLLGLACLMSAAFGNMERLRRFWRDELEARGFWEETSRKDSFAETIVGCSVGWSSGSSPTLRQVGRTLNTGGTSSTMFARCMNWCGKRSLPIRCFNSQPTQRASAD